MKRIFIAGLMALLFAAAPAAASVKSFTFTFAGNDATATGIIDFEMSLLGNPGRNVFDTSAEKIYSTIGGPYAYYGENISGLVTALSVTVSGASDGNGTFHLGDFDGVLFDTSTLLGGMDLTRELTTQTTVGGLWGTNINIDNSSPPQSSTGDFQLFSMTLGNLAPNGGNPYELTTSGGELMTLTSFAAVPEPSTYLLLCLGLGVVGFARKMMRRQG